jgi:hypothetical protein
VQSPSPYIIHVIQLRLALQLCSSPNLNLPQSPNHSSSALLSSWLPGIAPRNSLQQPSQLITLLRLALFATCCRFIDRTLYHELKQISQTPSLGVSVELDSLPRPNSTSKSTCERRSNSDSSHAALSKILFALCFSESCTLFLLLMCQASGILNTQ